MKAMCFVLIGVVAVQSVGIALARSGDHAAGLEHYLQTRALWVAMGNRRGELITLNNIGIVYEDLCVRILEGCHVG